MSKANNCYYCQTLFDDKEAVEKIYESEYVFAFHNPQAKYERDVIIVSKKHIPDLTKLIGEDEIYLWEMVKVAKYVAKSFIDSVGNARLINDMGNLQKIPHLSFRLIAGKDLK